MPKKKIPEKENVEGQAGAPIVLVGRPGAMKGELFLHNPGEARMVFRGAALRGETITRREAAVFPRPVEEMMVARKVPAVIVKPGEQRRVPLRFALDPTTPPGEYHASMQMGDQTWPVVFHVTEQIDVDISPNRLVVHNQAGATVTKEIVIRNFSNVELEFEEISVVPLDDELAQCRILRAVANVIGSREESDLDEILTEFARQSKNVLDQAGLLRVRNRSGSFTLQPGELRRIEIEVRLPDTLEKRTRYRAVLPIYNADLTISIVPALDAQTNDKPRVN